jgi:hypothetical protein
VRAALATWKVAPTQIESDLLLRGIDIHAWHRGSLSSRRLLVLLRWLPDDSAYKREGGYTEAEYMLAETHNEIARLRASYHVVNGGEDAAYEPFEFVDPRIAEARAEAAALEDVEAEEDTEDFYKDMGWT